MSNANFNENNSSQKLKAKSEPGIFSLKQIQIIAVIQNSNSEKVNLVHPSVVRRAALKVYALKVRTSSKL